MLVRPGGLVQAACACLLAVAAWAVILPRPVRAQVEAKRAEAVELKDKIAEQGEKLSIADEEYNKARLERQRIEGQADAARDLVAAAEARWVALRSQLSGRVRMLYKHPGAPLDAWLGAHSVFDLARAHKFGASILTADNQLVLSTEKARQEVIARAERLDGIRSSARSKEQELASKRNEVGEAIAAQKALLDNVTDEIAQLMEEQRQREIEAARKRAEAAAAAAKSDDPSLPLIGDDDGDDADDGAAVQPPEEPTTPPPPVKGGAGKAVQTAAAQIGKPYEWAADGPDSFDCSGLTMYAWASAGTSLPHSSQAQFSSLPHVARSQLQPGDLVFFGSPIHHVGIYEGGGVMINAPETGENVRRDSISRTDYVGAARP